MLKEKFRALFSKKDYDDKGKYKINADYVRFYAREECYRELMVSYLPMLPLLEHTVKLEEADYILYMHMYARCEEYSEFVVRQLRQISKIRKEGAEIIVLGKAANAEKLLHGEISNITFWGDHFTEKLGKKFDMPIKEKYFVYDDIKKQLCVWPVNGCLLKCKFCRRCYMDIKFESLSLEEIKANLDKVKEASPELLHTISLRAENLTEYGIDLYGKPMLHKVIDLIDSYDEVKEIKIPIGICIGEITKEILDSLCRSKKFKKIAMNIEAGSDRLLKLVGKPHTLENVRYIFNKIHEENPDVYISTNVILGLPTEDIYDILETAKLIADIRPSYLQINMFVCTKDLPLASYPQVSESCAKYHLKLLLKFLKSLKLDTPLNLLCMCREIEKNPNSRHYVRKMSKLNSMNEKNVRYGYLPRFFMQEVVFKNNSCTIRRL